MGRVYLAEDPNIERRIALKVLMSEGLSRGDRKEMRQRFLQEARAAGGLSHPGIVTVYDADTDPESGYPYLAMEWVQGVSLRTLLLREEKLAPGRAVTMAAQVARALDYAHRRQVVHRDVKPANLLVTAGDGHPGTGSAENVKVVDFGIAKLVSKSLTQPGRVLGSPYYMAPEQVRGLAVDGRTDLFALGAVLYECLAGRPAFGGETVANVNHKILSVDPRPIEHYNPAVSPALKAVVERSLEKLPQDRYQNGAEMAAALEDTGAELALGASTGPSATSTTRTVTDTGALPPPRTPVDTEAMTEQRGQVPGADATNWWPGALAVSALVLIAGVLVGRTLDPRLLGGAFAELPEAAGEAGAQTSEPGAQTSEPVPKEEPTVPVARSDGASEAAVPPVEVTESEDGPATWREPLALETIEVAVTVAPPVDTTNLEIVHENRLKLAYLSVWVDGRRALSAKLEAKGLFKRRKEHSWLIPVPAGKRSVEVRVSGVSKELEVHRKAWRQFSVSDPQRLVVELPSGARRLDFRWQAR